MAKLTSAERNALPSSDFAEPKERKYPIEDASHARNAEARSAQHAGPSEKSKINAKVHKKFPAIGKEKSVMGHMGKSSGHGHHASTHHGGHQTMHVHLHVGGKGKKFSI